ncbi:MAG: DUF4184 family protein, partial [Streptomyces sp.]|nr:DUF4184 family protein [Streptomyces sp.]
MPFTFSHPAAVLPLLPGGRPRGPLVASALVAGSLAPDVPYFTESLVHGTFRYGEFTHSLLGVPTADVAIAAVLAAGWHWLLREPLVALLPAAWADAADALTAPGGRRRGPADAGWFVLSAVAGAATHVVWDAFTHGGRAGVRLLPVLDRTVLGHPL